MPGAGAARASVPELTGNRTIKLNHRVSLRDYFRSIWSKHRTLPHAGVHRDGAGRSYSGRRLRFYSQRAPVIMPKPGDSSFPPEYDLFERRSKGRTVINRGALLFFMGNVKVHSCCVRDVTNDGASIRLNGLNIVPSDFGISFDNFRTMRRCRLIWRGGDFIGASFETEVAAISEK
jgi:hypothetical protein